MPVPAQFSVNRFARILRKAARLLALASFGTALGLLVLEFAVLRGIFGYHGVREVTAAFQYDARWGWRFIPGASGEHSDLDFAVHYQINSHGLRQPEVQYEKPPGVFRILVLGDSFTEGYGVEAEQSYPFRLGELLRGDGLHVEVINAGLRGTSSDQHLLFLLEEGLRYTPDLVLLGFVRGDENNTPVAGYMGARIYFKPYFKQTPAGLELQGLPVPPPDLSAIRGDAWEPVKKLLRPTALYRWTQTTLLGSGLRKSLAGAGLVKTSTPSAAERNTGPGLLYGADAWQVTEQLLIRIKAATEAQGGQFALFLVAGDESYARQLQDIAGRCGTPFLDVANHPAFQQAVARGDFRLIHDGHWNARGHAAAAKMLRTFLSAQHFARAAAR